MLANEMILFYHVVRLKSFSQAAEKLNLSKAFVSKHISQLEKELKTRLLIRNTRQLTLTEIGETFYLQCEKMFTLAQKSYEDLANFRNQPAGTLKISVPPAAALHLLAKPLADYQLRYPEVTLNVILESKVIDLVQQGYDLAIRSAILPDSNLIARKLGMEKYFLCASPQYIEKYGMIEHPDQLSQHRFAIYSSGASTQIFEFIRGNRQFKITVEGKFQSNQLDLMVQMVKADCCVAVLPEFMVAAEIANGQLKTCLNKYRLPAKPIYIIYPKHDFMPLKIKLFIDLLKAHFAGIYLP